ncbi:carboxypeptidase regulatory-like domain-containing protein, partial [Candidatus Bathyarchaeota archaeon]|nr:carboxypeptidase regulatory-like domain-containing protein [Candidatus Bathyarchaeota archaeon]
GTVSNPDPQLDGGVITWWLNKTMEPFTTIVIEFNTTASSFPGVNLLNVVRANGTDPWGNVLMPQASAFVTVSSAGVVSGYIENVTVLPVLPVPGVTVWLYNGTDDSVNATAVTDGNGFYMFTGVAPGSYYVRYNSSDPDLGSLAPYTDDDPSEPLADPLITSRTFALPPNGVYVHDFEVALTVDLVLDKTGPASAELGDVVTYNYTVTNQGDTGAAGVVVDDDVCGNATYVSGDTSLDGLLDPGETWLFVCNHTVSVSDPNPLVNVAVVNTTSKDSDPGNNEDT